MQVPTRTVRVLASGHVCVINASDFDATVHVDLASEAELPEAPQPVAPDVVRGLTALNAADAKALIADASTSEELDILEAEELAHGTRPGGRKGVLAAIAERRAELEE